MHGYDSDKILLAFCACMSIISMQNGWIMEMNLQWSLVNMATIRVHNKGLIIESMGWARSSKTFNNSGMELQKYLKSLAHSLNC